MNELVEQLRTEMVRLQQAGQPHKSIALLLEWLFLPASDPRQAAAAELARPMFNPGEDPKTTEHPGNNLFRPRLVVLICEDSSLNVGIRINGWDGNRVRYIQYPPLPPCWQEILEQRVHDIAAQESGPRPSPTDG